MVLGYTRLDCLEFCRPKWIWVQAGVLELSPAKREPEPNRVSAANLAEATTCASPVSTPPPSQGFEYRRIAQQHWCAFHSKAPISMTESLCRDCVHCKQVISGTGSRFWLCKLSHMDRRYPKYPMQPVVCCQGFARIGSEPAPATQPAASPR
jgi:hypothetical protein